MKNYHSFLVRVLLFLALFASGCSEDDLGDIKTFTVLSDGIKVENGVLVFDTNDDYIEVMSNAFNSKLLNKINNLDNFTSLEERFKKDLKYKKQAYEDNSNFDVSLFENETFTRILNENHFFRIGDKIHLYQNNYHYEFNKKFINLVGQSHNEIVKNSNVKFNPVFENVVVSKKSSFLELPDGTMKEIGINPPENANAEIWDAAITNFFDEGSYWDFYQTRISRVDYGAYWAAKVFAYYKRNSSSSQFGSSYNDVAPEWLEVYDIYCTNCFQMDSYPTKFYWSFNTELAEWHDREPVIYGEFSVVIRLKRPGNPNVYWHSLAGYLDGNP